MKKLFSTVAILASIVGLLYLVYNFLCDRFGEYEDEDLYCEEFDDCICDGECTCCEAVVEDVTAAEPCCCGEDCCCEDAPAEE